MPRKDRLNYAPPTPRSRLDAWQKHFELLYASATSLSVSPDYHALHDMWLSLVEGMRHLSKPIRKSAISPLIDHLPQTFCLLCGCCTKAGIRLADVTWEFFPYICPTCYRKPCICGSSKLGIGGPKQKDEKLLQRYRRKNGAYRPDTIDDYVRMFALIYHNHPDSSSFVNIYLHLSEEVAEVAQHVREIRECKGGPPLLQIQRNLRSEIADVFSWLCKLCWRIDLEWQGFIPWIEEQGLNSRTTKSVRGPSRITDFGLNRQILLSSLLLRSYRNGCPKCRMTPCRGTCGQWGSLCATESD